MLKRHNFIPMRQGGMPGEGDGGGEGGDTPSLDMDAARSLSLSDMLGSDHELVKEPALGNYMQGSVGDLAKGYVSAQKMIGDPNSLIKIPGSDPTSEEGSEEWGGVYSKLGRPGEAKEYKMPDELNVEMQTKLGLTTETLSEFGDIAHKLGLSQHQFKGVMDWYLGFGNSQIDAFTQEQQAASEEAAAAIEGLKKEWGSAYDDRMNMGVAAIEEAMGDDAKDLVAAIEETGLGDNPLMLKFLASVGESMQEDNGGGESRNSFDNALTPAQATAKIAELQSDTDFQNRYMDANHPGHAEAVKTMTRLFEYQNPSSN